MATVHGGGADLDHWLAPFLEVLGRKMRRTGRRLLQGLLGPGERKSRKRRGDSTVRAGLTVGGG
jgi:hypothetical protein